VRFLVIVCLFCCLLCCLFAASSLPTSAASQQVCLPTQVQADPPPIQPGTVLINEVLLSSKKALSCPGSTAVPGIQDTAWIELYNPKALPFNLYSVQAAIDGGPGTSPMFFPFGSTIAAHGFLTIFPDKSTIFPNGTAETLIRRLLFNDTTIIDQITVPPNLGDGQSYARVPDGASKWVITDAPTMGNSNVLPTPTPKVAHTPKPTPTPKTAATPKSAPSKKKSSVSTTPSAQTSTTFNGASSNPPTINGSQPTWNQLQLPASSSANQTTPATTTNTSIDTSATSPPPNSNNGDALRTMLIIAALGTIAACSALWWRRRRFKHP
jgi:outer membrane biosynthesis protein TonB